ncbi:sulfatase [Carboxylicivirga sp. RSCT41]|uniref:sulfatase n=1 Tax=Carboxylicivirga agarovorans TaxID=3417570 RepID=UPI003D358DD9
MDTGVYGSEYYETPNIDRLAKMGMRFTNAYSANPLCSPSRAALLTGRYPARFDFTSAAGHLPANPDMVSGLSDKGADWQKVVTPHIRNYMPLEERTIAEVLKAEGYTTVHLGKWHLGDEGYTPEKQGFDYNIGGYNLGWPRSYFSPYKNEKISDGPEGEHLTDRLSSDAIDFIKNNREKPFFMNLWYFTVHDPFQAKKELVEKYEQKNDPRGRQGFPVMAAMIETLDQNIGRLTTALEEMEMMDNTVIIFTSDNGGVEYEAYQGQTPTDNYPLRDGKANVHEGGVRVPCIVHWPGQTQAGSVSNQVISGVDFFPTLLDMVSADQSALKNEIDGVSLTEVLKSDKPLQREGIFIDFPHYTIFPSNYPSTVLINDEWKFIRVYGHAPEGEDFYELYRINEDIEENFNVAAYYPKVVKKLDAQVSKHIKEIGHHEPRANPAFNPKVINPMGKKLKVVKKENIVSK